MGGSKSPSSLLASWCFAGCEGGGSSVKKKKKISRRKKGGFPFTAGYWDTSWTVYED